jgi:hypothetical protein
MKVTLFIACTLWAALGASQNRWRRSDGGTENEYLAKRNLQGNPPIEDSMGQGGFLSPLAEEEPAA